MTTSRHPPLWTWAIALLLAGVVVLASWAAISRLTPRYDAAYFGLDRLNADGRALPTIVLIGTSKTRCGVEFDDRMSARMAALGTPARVVRITLSLATLKDFANVFSRLEQVRPTAVLIESELGTLEPNTFGMRGLPQWGDWRAQARHSLMSLLPASVLDRQAPENHGAMWMDCGSGVVGRAVDIARVRASSPNDRAPLVQAARILHGERTRVLLLDLPSRNDAIGRKPVPLVKAQQAAMRQLEGTHLFERINNPPPLPADLFQDAGHLNPRGQAVTSAWLAATLSSWLRRRQQP